MYDTQAYLAQFTPEQRLEAMIKLYQDDNEALPVTMLRMGFRLARADGWKLVAPCWMKEFETDGIKPLEDFEVAK
jgi:hypothetical protein